MMKALQRFLEGMNRLIGKSISLNEIGYESIEFEKEEIDKMLIPSVILEPLPEPIVTSSVDYTDWEGNYYLYLTVSSESIDSPPYEVWLVNGEVIPNVFGRNDDVH